MSRKKDDSNFEGFIIGTIFGAAISAVATLLFAPKSGEDLRKDIGEGTVKTLESTDEYLELAREKGSEVMEDVEEAASTYFNLADDKVEDISTKTKDSIDHQVDELEHNIEDTTEKIEKERVEE